MEDKTKNYLAKYDEVEKDHAVACGISQNNAILFEMIKDHVDSFITQRLIAFREGIPSISESPTALPIVDYKQS